MTGLGRTGNAGTGRPLSPTRRRRRTAAAWIALAGVAASGCGIADKQAQADRLHASRQRVADASPAAGTLRFELTIDDSQRDQLEAEQRELLEQALAQAGPAGKPSIVFAAGLDARRRSARVAPNAAAGAASPGEALAIFADTRVFVRRQNARPTERRKWATLDLDDLIERERPLDVDDMAPGAVLNAVASTVNPLYFVDLVAGALAGSVRVTGSESVAGIATTRYDANISFDKALTELDLDDDQRETRMRLFRLLGARKDVVPASIWLDAEGRLRRLKLELEQRISRQRANQLTVVLELVEFGGQLALDPPARDVTVTYDRFGRLVRSALPPEL